MNKATLIDVVAKSLDLSKSVAADAVNATLHSIVEAVANGDTVNLVGFGSFKPASRAAREARNPATGETVKVPATVTPRFSAGKSFKEAVAIRN
ncbi:MAG: HU family DNA-binding protein [Ferrovum myxofaciens]|uniref:HU family DNA-binding protein n=1 Tax=Ferrovum myxofaciens TaxID=416213 RepID=A0A9E6SXR3_9PROT|nr:MAG: HU family DNA-binding protein [Ferrovum myxofaciens]QWY75012.1 MAG: HU family DNA-binding protein [Ferrovum myxofaciens]QWY77752.1 MAG: HU family DNA-binding protein [Ferrovum myxofaciens]